MKIILIISFLNKTYGVIFNQIFNITQNIEWKKKKVNYPSIIEENHTSTHVLEIIGSELFGSYNHVAIFVCIKIHGTIIIFRIQSSESKG